MRKARPEAVLKTLPPGVQAELWNLLHTTTYQAAVKLVREKWGVQTGTTALSRFFDWYPRSRILERAATVTDEVVGKLKAAGIDLDDDTASKAGQAFFETLALQEGNADLFLDLRKLRQKDKENALRENQQALRLRQYEDKFAAIRKQVDTARTAPAANADEIRAAAVAEIDRIMGLAK